MNFNIILGKGIDEISFDMKENEVISILGKPDKIFKTDFNCIRYQYFNEMLELSFEPENNNSLGWIEVHNPKALLFNKKLIGMKEKDILKYIDERIDDTPKIDDFGSFVSIDYEKYWLELQFKFDSLTNINFGKI